MCFTFHVQTGLTYRYNQKIPTSPVSVNNSDQNWMIICFDGWKSVNYVIYAASYPFTSVLCLKVTNSEESDYRYAHAHNVA
mgnify:CR=1 FL=1